MHYLYVLECVDGTYYTGSTVDLGARFWQHQDGVAANYTAKRLPVKLVYWKEYRRIEDAFNREKQLQGWSQAKKKALIDGNTDALPELSRNHRQFGRPIVSDSPAQI